MLPVNTNSIPAQREPHYPTLPPKTLMADKDPPSLTPPEDYTPLVVALRVIEQAGMSSLRRIEGGAWDLSLRLAFSPSFSLERKVSEKFKAASIGPPRGCLNA